MNGGLVYSAEVYHLKCESTSGCFKFDSDTQRIGGDT